jgi:hypothetical protein
MSARIRCQVIEVPTDDGWLARRGGGPRELLPWADPYIAGLMRRLENRFEADEIQERDQCDPFVTDFGPASVTDFGPASVTDFGPASAADFGDGWEADAFMPRPLEAPRFHTYPPVYGGYPLLEDASDR